MQAAALKNTNKFSKVVPHMILHTHVVKGDERMESKPIEPKEFIFGNTTVVIHSPLVHMTKEEQRQFFNNEWEKGNPTLINIVKATVNCQRQY